MADIVVRELEDGLVRQVRADAALRGESLKEWMVRIIQEALNGKMRAVVETLVQTGEVQAVRGGSKGNGESAGKPEGKAQASEVRTQAPEGGRPSHDSATCQLRGCGMCKVLGVKDPGRGLK